MLSLRDSFPPPVTSPNQHHPLIHSYLKGLPLAKDKHVQALYVRVLVEDVGLGMVLEMSMVPPVGRGTL